MAEVQHDEAGHRFYIPLESGHEALLLYRKQGKTLDFYHTYVPEAHRNQGLAEQVVEAGFHYAKVKGFQVLPTCPYVSTAFLHKHPEFLPLVTPAR